MKTPSTIGVNLRVTGHCNQGGRKYMEDVFCVAYQQTEDDKDLEYAFFGIFDGHGGGEAAAYAKEHLMDNIVNQKNFWSEDDNVVLKAIKEGFLATHQGMWKELPKWPKTASGLPSTSGTTASIAFIRKAKIYVGHVGDSGIVLGSEEEEGGGGKMWVARQLTHDHKPTIPEEKDRIERNGGKVKYKSGVLRVVWNRPRLGHKGPVRRSTRIDEIPFLAVARSLGDLWSYNSETDEFVVSPEPDVFVIDIDVKKHRVLVFGTDGLWNMISPWAAVHTVQETEKQNEAQIIAKATSQVNNFQISWVNPSKRLVDHALDRWYDLNLRADNVSAVTVMLDPPGPPKSEVILRQYQQRKKPKYKVPDRMSVHSNVYDSKTATVPLRVPLFTNSKSSANVVDHLLSGSSSGESSGSASAEGAENSARRNDKVGKPLMRARHAPESATAQRPGTSGENAVVQSPEVSSSIDDTVLTPGKGKSPPMPPKGKIHRVSGSLFVQNQEPPRPIDPMGRERRPAPLPPTINCGHNGPASLVDHNAPVVVRDPAGSSAVAAPVVGHPLWQDVSRRVRDSSAQTPAIPGVPRSTWTDAARSTWSDPSPAPPPVLPRSVNAGASGTSASSSSSAAASSSHGQPQGAIDTLSKIVDRMWVAPTPAERASAAPVAPPAAAPPAPAVTTAAAVSAAPSAPAPAPAPSASKPLEGRVLRSTHHHGLPAEGKTVVVEPKATARRSTKSNSQSQTPKKPEKAPRVLRSTLSASEPKARQTRSATKAQEKTPRTALKRKRSLSPTKPAGKTPAKKKRASGKK